MTSAKESISRLAAILKAKGIKNVVFSPGSRNAPLIISIANDPYFRCYNIPDERSAAFFAMGIGLATRQPVVICCTSGSAAINYGPAISEAYYQKIPLLVLTADRPQEWIDQRAGQTIRQTDLYRNYIKFSTQLSQEVKDQDDLWYNDRLINQAIETATSGGDGPVHINIPLKEPLYGQVPSFSDAPKMIAKSKTHASLSKNRIQELRNQFDSHDKVLVICGQHHPDQKWSEAITRLSKVSSVVVLTELTSNVYGDNIISCIDRTINNIEDLDVEDYKPSLLITCGYSLVSKKIRFLLRDMDILQHWHVDQDDEFIDTYKSLTDIIPVGIDYFAEAIIQRTDSLKNPYKKRWLGLDSYKKEKHEEYLDSAPWSDLKVVHQVMNALPDETHVHMANSTSVRYAQLFDVNETLTFQCNRGVSGIDGCNSTSVGYAINNTALNVLITGDIAFFYDANAFWNAYVPANYRVLILNNQGGNIFRVIPGPATTDHLDTHFEAHHKTKATGIALAHGLTYLAADDPESLDQGLVQFLGKSDQAMILEVFTPRLDNDKILKAYFQHIRMR